MRLDKERNHTQSPSGSDPRTRILTSLDLAVVTEAPRASFPRYSWHPDVLSIEIVGADPCMF
jgi:hypothetical protein